MKFQLFWGIAFAAVHLSHSNIPESCQQPQDEGVGTSFIFFLYYDSHYDQCSPFIFKGQGGNANRFRNELECIRNCSDKAEETYPEDVSKMCTLPKRMGDCGGNFLKYYYDAAHQKCKTFFWSGCHGNGNRFSDYFACNRTCAGIKHDKSTSDEPEEDDSEIPIAIICGVLLAVIVVAVLITAIVLTVQSKKKSPKKKVAEKSKDPQSASPLQEQGIEMA
ncbi:hypothetical protein Q5P01_012504 [Channa striata]|uniref:BPTI/Kunitz inhibitor domain-containing protein n=1 Tax=Channa striata TaxID=64152 RepID=A0AA88SR75_CHASR|nr:hypothetical protein Q5P01_012504 [Channa striata]